MSAADNPKRVDRDDLVEIIADGEFQSVTYRKAVGLISLGRADWANPEDPAEPVEKPKPRKRAAKKAAKP